MDIIHHNHAFFSQIHFLRIGVEMIFFLRIQLVIDFRYMAKPPP